MASLSIDVSSKVIPSLPETPIASTEQAKMPAEMLLKLATILQIEQDVVTEQNCFDKALEACEARKWTLIKECGKPINYLTNKLGLSLLLVVIHEKKNFSLAEEMIEQKIALHTLGPKEKIILHDATKTHEREPVTSTVGNIDFDSSTQSKSVLHLADLPLKLPISNIAQVNPILPYFAKRKTIYMKIQNHIFSKIPGPVILWGGNGKGKSELAISFAHSNRTFFSFIATVQADTQDNLLQSYRALAAQLHISFEINTPPDTIISTLHAHLENLKKPFLIIYNDVEKEISLPGTGSLLITTQKDTLFSMYPQVEVPPLTPKEAIELLQNILGQGLDQVQLENLAQEMNFLPISLVQAASYIRATPPMTITQYIDLTKLHTHQKEDINYPKSLYTAFTLAQEKLLETPTGQIANQWLKLCAYLHPDGIPICFFDLWLKNIQSETDSSRKESLRNDILFALVNLNLITHNIHANTLSLHRAKQAILRTRSLSEDSTPTAAAQQALAFIASK